MQTRAKHDPPAANQTRVNEAAVNAKLLCRCMVLCVCLCLLGGLSSIAWAQNFVMPQEQVAEVEAADGLLLEGSYYPAPNSDGRNLLLIHMNGGSRQSWNPILPALIQGGYHVLVIDLRGHGETGGRRNSVLSLRDLPLWLHWLRNQAGVRAEAKSTIGGGMGANMAMILCADDPQCVTAIALNPAPTHRGVSLATRIAGLPSVLIVASTADPESWQVVTDMRALLPLDHGARLLDTPFQATDLLLSPERDAIGVWMVQWLHLRTPAAPP
jgi:pimeloyl-ACP methyl ester carboxylesterase